MTMFRPTLLVCALLASVAAAELLDPASYTVQNATVVADGKALEFAVGDKGSLGQAQVALDATYKKRVTVRASVTGTAKSPYGNWTIHLGDKASDQRVGAGYAPGSKEAWLGEWNGLSQKIAQDRQGGATGGPSIDVVFTVDLEKKTMIAMFGTTERTLPILQTLPGIDSLWLTSYKQGVKLTALTVTGE